MIGLYDTKLGMILVQTTFIMPFVIVIVRQTFIDLPIELEEAAMVDGATHIGAFLRVAVPLSFPIIVASVVIMFSFAWNDYFFGLVLNSTTTSVLPLITKDLPFLSFSVDDPINPLSSVIIRPSGKA